ncbi:porin [Pandoraea terrigena]|uniref:Outer membrane porin protein n=1 Tax=Pandoraea terrigena TaxID=2508292 RepID=A0A5E4UCK2_9BURK|nr:porin [Pandoraea terrigena]VVD97272.1 Outer membrane porin protein [Pandoraea terrigena]
MKRVLNGTVVATALLASVHAHAQGGVTLYGLIDTGVDWESHAATAPGQTSAPGSAIRMTSLSSALPSRWGLRGKEDLGSGLSAIFELESGFAPNSGTLQNGNRIFGRSAWVGIESPYGTVRVGRQINMTYVALMKSTVLGPALYSLAALDPYLPNSRSDNTLSYFNDFHHFVMGATYSTGRDAQSSAGSAAVNGGATYNPGATNCPGSVAGSPTSCRQITALAGYWGPEFGLQLVYDELRGGPGALPGSVSFDPSMPLLLSSASQKTTRYMVSGYAQLGDLSFRGGAIHRMTAATMDYQTNIFYIGASYMVAPDVELDGEISRITTTDQKNANYYVMRATYLLSKRTSIYTMLGFMQNNSRASYAVGAGYFTVAGAKQTGVLFGVQQRF